MSRKLLSVTACASMMVGLASSMGCHLLFGHAPAWEVQSPCFLCSAQIYRALPDGSEFTEEWRAYIYPLALDDPQMMCDYRVQEYVSTSMAPGFNWQYRLRAAQPFSQRPKAADCLEPSFLPKTYGAPLGVELQWDKPPRSQASVAVSLIDKNGVSRRAEPAVANAAIELAERTGMPDWSLGGNYALGREHIRFSDLYLELKTPFALGNLNVESLYLRSVGTIVAEKDGPGTLYKIYPSAAKIYLYGYGTMDGDGAGVSFCFANQTSTHALTLYQGPPYTSFTLSLNLTADVIGENMQVQVSLSKPAALISQFNVHQPFVQLWDRQVEETEVDLAPDIAIDHDGDLVKFLWFEEFESGAEEYLGTGNPLRRAFQPGAHSVTVIAYDSRGAYGTDTMRLNFIPPLPPNDHCENATPVGTGLTMAHNFLANTDWLAACANSRNDVWFTYTPGCDSYVRVSTCDSQGTLKDTVLTVMNGCNSQELACNDDACGFEGRRSRVGVWAAGGVPLLIRVASYGETDPGTFPLRIEAFARPLAVARPGFYATDGDGSLEDHLFSAATEGALFEDRGLLGMQNVEGLAYDSKRGLLFGADTASDSLVVINPQSGLASPVGPLGSDEVRGLAYAADRDTLFGTDTSDDRLLAINVHTGRASGIGTLGFTQVVGLAYDPSIQRLYGTDLDSNQLILIDPGTAESRAVMSLGPSGHIEGLAIRERSIFGLLDALGTGQLVELRPRNGKVLPVGPTVPGLGARGLEYVAGLLDAEQYAPYTQALPVFGGCPPYTFSGPTGLPPGMQMTPWGELTGTPTAAGLFTIGFTVRDRNLSTPAVAGNLPLRVIPVSGPAPVLTAAVSRKAHGTSGSFDIALPLALPDSGVESRNGGPTLVVFTFSEAVHPIDGLLDASEVEISTGTVTSLQVAGNQLLVGLSGVPDQACLVVVLNGLANANSLPLQGDNDVHIRCLQGDVTGDGVVASADITQVKARSGQAVSPDNARFDLTSDGVIASADITQVKARSGHAASCP